MLRIILVACSLLATACIPQADARGIGEAQDKDLSIRNPAVREQIKPTQPSPAPGSESGAMAGMTAEHNRARADVGQNLPDMIWDPKLAQFAQEWANSRTKSCSPLKHRPNNPYGENIAGGLKGDTAKDVFALWHAEKGNFDTKTKKCKPGTTCGHYTQIIWKNSFRVGCAVASCDCSAPGSCWAPNASIWVCNYSPPGNYTGQTPY